MGNVCKTCKMWNKERKNITILLAGLDNAGKTTIAKTLAGESVNSVLKTVGFSLVVLNYRGFKITLYDVGGSSNIREIWNKYYMDVHGIIYVVDGSDSVRFPESKRVFVDLLSHENVGGKHVLLLAHKQDKDNAFDELEIVEHLNLEYIVNKYRCPTRVEVSSAVGLPKIDQGLKNGFRWLLDNVIANYNGINERVNNDMVNYASLIEKSREEWRNRMKLKVDSPKDTTAIENGNPFQPINSVIAKANDESNTLHHENGIVVKPVLVNNFVKKETYQEVSNQYKKLNLSTGIQNSIITTTNRVFEEQKNKLNKRYRRHKKRFCRFNKTAPMPIDSLIRGKSVDSQSGEISNNPLRTEIKNFTKAKLPRNYLIRRPATAPPKVNLAKLKTEAAWNLTASLESSRSVRSPDDGDVISYF